MRRRDLRWHLRLRRLIDSFRPFLGSRLHRRLRRRRLRGRSDSRCRLRLAVPLLGLCRLGLRRRSLIYASWIPGRRHGDLSRVWHVSTLRLALGDVKRWVAMSEFSVSSAGITASKWRNLFVMKAKFEVASAKAHCSSAGSFPERLSAPPP